MIVHLVEEAVVLLSSVDSSRLRAFKLNTLYLKRYGRQKGKRQKFGGLSWRKWEIYPIKIRKSRKMAFDWLKIEMDRQKG